jgi:NADH-quinone oxidoreductase subunit A
MVAAALTARERLRASRFISFDPGAETVKLPYTWLGSDRRPRLEGASMLRNWLPFLIFGLFAAGITTLMLFISFSLSSRARNKPAQQGLPFESGVSAGPPEHRRFTIGFYLTAMLFILFDIEIVFLYPLAVILHELAWFGFGELVVFIGLLAVAYVYVWRKGALEWE